MINIICFKCKVNFKEVKKNVKIINNGKKFIIKDVEFLKCSCCNRNIYSDGFNEAIGGIS